MVGVGCDGPDRISCFLLVTAKVSENVSWFCFDRYLSFSKRNVYPRMLCESTFATNQYLHASCIDLCDMKAC